MMSMAQAAQQRLKAQFHRKEKAYLEQKAQQSNGGQGVTLLAIAKVKNDPKDTLLTFRSEDIAAFDIQPEHVDAVKATGTRMGEIVSLSVVDGVVNFEVCWMLSTNIYVQLGCIHSIHSLIPAIQGDQPCASPVAAPSDSAANRHQGDVGRETQGPSNQFVHAHLSLHFLVQRDMGHYMTGPFGH